MSDISSKLLELIITDIISNKSKLEKYQNLLKNNNASYKEADDYAVALGEITKAAFDNNVNSAVLPNGRMYYNIANAIISKVLQSNFTDINKYCQEVQKLFNDNKGLTFNPVNVNINNDRLKGLIQSIADAENYDKVSKQFTESLINYGQSIVTDNIKANADFQYKTGKVLPVIKRMSTGKCCKWCTSLVGTYKYTPDMDTAVFRRHANCRCLVEYDNGTGVYQNVHNKKFYTDQEEHIKKLDIERRKNVGKEFSDGTMYKAGAISGARNPNSKKAKEHAERYYGLVRSMKSDVPKIAKATGYTEKEIQEIKDFIFITRHDLGGGKLEYFEPDFMMAESWRRLISGKPEKHDLTLLKHEIMEKKLMQQGYTQAEAHDKTSKIHNYDKEANEFYGKIKKYKKE